VPVFNYGHVLGGLVPYELGGSQQTISIRLKDSAGRHWVLRSVNKDQKNVLPAILQPSLFRSVFRDQVSSMNPYGPKVVAMLSGVLQLPHVSPSLYWMPYDETHGKYNERMAGRLVYLEEHTDSTWRFTPQFMNATQIIETDELEALGKEKIPIDTLLYLKTRLFDMLVNDWDRHQDQWKWALVEVNGQRILRPIARDRDIAFYVFDEGIINRLAVGFNDKFQSFRPEFDNIKGLMKQSKKMDRQYLSGLPQSAFVSMATSIQAQLSSEQIAAAFQHYPPVIYKKYGRTHEAILAERLKRLTAAAAEFHKLVNKD
ncbi:MAG: hypothetical protein K0Q66_713, partial [Chitinophagaceae bacterium]|nr:hypothetical protein [Chitinophagaceae bacterium]